MPKDNIPARLIAAAPDLLAAAKYLVAACDAANAREDLPECFDLSMIDQAREAIAKATGETA